MPMTLKPQKAKSKTKFAQNLVIIGLVIALILTVVITNYVSSSALRDTVTIAVLKEDAPKDRAITSIDQFEQKTFPSYVYYQMNTLGSNSTKREIVLWKDLDGILKTGAYAAVYIAAGRPIYYADLSKTGTQKNSYLYSMDGELVRLDITPTDFGDMVVPGDKLNIRMTYETDDHTLPTEEEFNALTSAGADIDSSVTVTETIFSEVTILDMLNGNGESIFDLYYELLTYPEAKRSQIINSEDFAGRVAPTCILLSVTSEEAERYAKIKGKKGDYLITLLPRDGTTEILDALDELKTGFARE